MTGNYRVTAVSQAAGSAAAQEPVAPGPVAPPPGLPLAEPASEARREAVRARAAAARSLPVRVRVRKRRLPRGLSGANGGLRVVLLEHVELSPELYHPDLRRHRRPRRGCASDAAGGVDAATGANCAALAACCNAIPTRTRRRTARTFTAPWPRAATAPAGRSSTSSKPLTIVREAPRALDRGHRAGRA